MSRDLEPPVYLDPDPSPNGNIVQLADGRVFSDVEIALPDEQVEQIRQGYRCIRCHEPQSQAWPERCEMTLPNGARWCNYPIRSRQAQEFAIQYGGEVRIGSRINLEDEAARLLEMDEYEDRTGIILPDKVKFPDGPI